jgi:hypothetical protein
MKCARIRVFEDLALGNVPNLHFIPLYVIHFHGFSSLFDGVLTPLSTIFQLYRGGQFY